MGKGGSYLGASGRRECGGEEVRLFEGNLGSLIQGGVVGLEKKAWLWLLEVCVH